MEKKKTVNIDLKQYMMLITLVVIFALFYVLSDGKNASPTNINNLIMQNGYVVILATGMLLCVLTGNVDLGVGSVVALSGATAGIIMIDYQMSPVIAVLAALAVGLIAGVFAGFFIAFLNIPPFVVTLATMLMGRGLTYTILDAQTKGPFEDTYSKIGGGFLPTVQIDFAGGKLDLVCIAVAIVVTILLILSELKTIKTNNKYGFPNITTWQLVVKDVIIIALVWFFFYKLACYHGIPVQLVIMAVIVGIYHFITSKTVAGRQVYALGGNAKAARLSGINTKKVFFWVYTNMGVLAAVAGIVLSARNASATPKAGDGYELDAIGSCYIGGAAAAGGVGTIIGAVVGAFVMGILNNGMSLVGMSTDFQKVVKGIVLLGAVTFDVLSSRKKN